jgi:hypothetical protein
VIERERDEDGRCLADVPDGPELRAVRRSARRLTARRLVRMFGPVPKVAPIGDGMSPAPACVLWIAASTYELAHLGGTAGAWASGGTAVFLVVWRYRIGPELRAWLRVGPTPPASQGLAPVIPIRSVRRRRRAAA